MRWTFAGISPLAFHTGSNFGAGFHSPTGDFTTGVGFHGGGHR
jgi:hypothetical protein